LRPSLRPIRFLLGLTLLVVAAAACAVLPPEPSSRSAPSGVAMPSGDLPGWREVFADDFADDVPAGSFPQAVGNKWDAYRDGWHDTSRNGTYMPSRAVHVANGVLTIHLHTENGVHMVAALVPRIPGGAGPRGGLLYGRYAVRFRADPVPCYKTAWLLWPDSEVWPRDGEIDFPEGRLTDTISAYLHHQGASHEAQQDAFDTSERYGTWHTAVTEWSPGHTRFILDGVTVGTSTQHVPDTPMHWVLQTETATSNCTPSDGAAGDVQIDWVTAYVRH
jgi:beta-glucanase (GH16 family)